jgi:hypothetical protein
MVGNEALLEFPMEEAFADVPGPQCAVTVEGRNSRVEVEDRVEK